MAVPMQLPAGTRLGHFEIVAPIGAGGMGEVYRAHDTRLGRDVAIKVLPADVSGDATRLRRFEDEARAAAALNHSNILALYDIGRDAGVTYLVTELLDGRTLRETLDAETLAVSRVIDLAAQIADGLAAAHGRNIVHRDIKPENVFITTDGRAKILDFGLAKTMDASAGDTPTRSATAPHTVLGTAGYMAPEQVRGQAVDHRADIFAFGAVLYEMLTGRRAFAGETVLDTMSAILREAPAPVVPTPTRSMPPSLLRIVDRCLEKSPAARFQSTIDLAFALKSLSLVESGAITSGLAPVLPPSVRWRQALPWTLAVVTTVAAVWLWHPWRPTNSETAARVQLPIYAPEGASFSDGTQVGAFTISPNGQYLLFSVPSQGGQPQLWIMSLQGGDLRPGPEAESGHWSPDSRSFAFMSSKEMRRYDLETGAVLTICDTPNFAGAAWGQDDTILIGNPRGGLQRCSVRAGTPTEITTPGGAGAAGHIRPSWLPDGEHFFYRAGRTIWLGSLDRSVQKLLFEADSAAQFVPPGWLLFTRGTTLFAQRFELGRLEPTGEILRLVEGIRAQSTAAPPGFAVSANGILVYRLTDPIPKRTLTWYDRNGNDVPGRAVNVLPAAFQGFALVSGETSIVARINAENVGRLWSIDLKSGAPTPIPSGPGDNGEPVLSPDSKEVAWSAGRTTPSEIVRRSLDGLGNGQQWVKLDADVRPSHWSSKYLVFTKGPGGRQTDIWVKPLDPPGEPRSYLANPASESRGQLSPDEKWMAYEVAAQWRGGQGGGQNQVYISPFPDASARPGAVLLGPGSFPRWSGPNEIIFIRAGWIVAATLTFKNDGSIQHTVGKLFEVPGVTGEDFAFTTPGAKRFLVALLLPPARQPLFQLVHDWRGLLAGR